MTNYTLEFYERNARVPYETATATLPNGFRPTYTNSTECFDRKLENYIKVKVRYASNGALAAIKYLDKRGNGRLRWFKR